ncbi:hypothetical protein BH10PSE19_BH10PSE19_09620 [soil metagenome]
MNNKSVLFLKRPNERLEVKICAIPDWEGFDKLIIFLKQQYDAKILAEYDGPDARRWILESHGQQFELIHDDMFGNYLVAPTINSENLVQEIGKDLEQRLENITK